MPRLPMAATHTIRMIAIMIVMLAMDFSTSALAADGMIIITIQATDITCSIAAAIAGICCATIADIGRTAAMPLRAIADITHAASAGPKGVQNAERIDKR